MDDRLTQVEQVLESLRPAMAADGGNVELMGISDGYVRLRLTGTCTMCPSAELTLRRGIEPALKQELPWVAGVTTSHFEGIMA